MKFYQNKLLLNFVRLWNKVCNESQYVRIMTERVFKQEKVYNYINIEMLK